MNNPKPFLHYLWKGPVFDEVESSTRVFFCGRETLVTDCLNYEHYRDSGGFGTIPLVSASMAGVPWSTKPSPVPVSVVREMMLRLSNYAQPAQEAEFITDYQDSPFAPFTHLPPPPKIEGSWSPAPAGSRDVFASNMEIDFEEGFPRGKSALSMTPLLPQNMGYHPLFIDGNQQLTRSAAEATQSVPPSVAERAAERGKAHIRDNMRRLRKTRT